VTLRRRVLAYLALVAVASCALSFAVGVILVRHRIATQRQGALVATANAVALFGGPPGALQAGTHVYRMGSGRPLPVRPRVRSAVLAAISAGGEANGTINLRGRSLLYVARRTAAGRVVLIRSAKLAFAEWRPFLTSLALAGLGGVLLAVLLSSVLARRLTRPIGALAAATRRVAAGETDVAVPVEGGDELSALGRSFNEMSAELARAREAERRFLESVSHELKTPLTSIRGYAEAVGEGAVGPVEAAEVIGDEAGRLQRLVQDLLDLGRLGRADFAVRRDPLDLGSIAAAVVRRHLPRAQALGVELTSVGAESSPVLGDEDRVVQVTSNLVENALRLTPAGGTVTIRPAPGRITVQDTGPGLAAEDLPRAFERFYLYDRYRSERVVGTGLGLAVVHALASAMGGSVAAANAPGGGAEFTLMLPIAEPGPSAHVPEATPTITGEPR
jgi:two-component system, OmpR family, sensor kinase